MTASVTRTTTSLHNKTVTIAEHRGSVTDLPRVPVHLLQFDLDRPTRKNLAGAFSNPLSTRLHGRALCGEAVERSPRRALGSERVDTRQLCGTCARRVTLSRLSGPLKTLVRKRRERMPLPAFDQPHRLRLGPYTSEGRADPGTRPVSPEELRALFKDARFFERRNLPLYEADELEAVLREANLFDAIGHLLGEDDGGARGGARVEKRPPSARPGSDRARTPKEYKKYRRRRHFDLDYPALHFTILHMSPVLYKRLINHDVTRSINALCRARSNIRQSVSLRIGLHQGTYVNARVLSKLSQLPETRPAFDAACRAFDEHLRLLREAPELFDGPITNNRKAWNRIWGHRDQLEDDRDTTIPTVRDIMSEPDDPLIAERPRMTPRLPDNRLGATIDDVGNSQKFVERAARSVLDASTDSQRRLSLLRDVEDLRHQRMIRYYPAKRHPVVPSGHWLYSLLDHLNDRYLDGVIPRGVPILYEPDLNCGGKALFRQNSLIKTRVRIGVVLAHEPLSLETPAILLHELVHLLVFQEQLIMGEDFEGSGHGAHFREYAQLTGLPVHKKTAWPSSNHLSGFDAWALEQFQEANIPGPIVQAARSDESPRSWPMLP